MDTVAIRVIRLINPLIEANCFNARVETDLKHRDSAEVSDN